MPNSDLFAAIRSGKASVVTDQIERFTETGIQLASGQELDADIIVTATGLNLVVLGEMQFAVDGEPVDFAETWTYKGMMYSGVPNLVCTFGYINASWTLRADLTSEYVCRLLNHMDETGTRQVHAAPARRRPRHAGAPVDRRLLVRLHAADDAPLPEAGRPRAVDQPAELRARQEDDPLRRARGRRARLRAIAGPPTPTSRRLPPRCTPRSKPRDVRAGARPARNQHLRALASRGTPRTVKEKLGRRWLVVCHA